MGNWKAGDFSLFDTPGVYAVFLMNIQDKKRKLLYIGSSKNMRKRVYSSGHPYEIINNSAKWPYFAGIMYRECDNFLQLEKTMIKRLKPFFNKHHK